MHELKNAATSTDRIRHSIMLVGGIGAGKTTTGTSLIGKKFWYLFDPNARAAIGLDKSSDYIEFIPDSPDELDLGVKTLKAGVGDKVAVKAEPRAYIEWEKDFTERRREKFFDQYQWIIFDSATAFQDIIYDRVMFLGGRLGKHPEQADHTAQMNLFRQDMRAAATLTNFCCTAHVETEKDGLEGRIYGRILMTGKNRLRVPSLFSHIFATEYDAETKKYVIYTKPTRMHPVVRTSIPNLQPIEDVTMDLNKPREGQGLGRIISRVTNLPATSVGVK
jgi:hypothetical protein